MVNNDANTVRPLTCKGEIKGLEVNANEIGIGGEEEKGDRGQGRGREESESEAAKRRKFLDKEEGISDLVGADLNDNSDDDGELQEEDQDAGDFRKMTKMLDPKMPSREEVEGHEMTHLPFRS